MSQPLSLQAIIGLQWEETPKNFYVQRLLHPNPLVTTSMHYPYFWDNTIDEAIAMPQLGLGPASFIFHAIEYT